MKKCFLYIQFLLVSMVLSTSAMAQPGGDENPNCDPVIGCPIDNGVLFLITVVVLIALKKAYDYKKSLAL